jgi:hypothetical protein
VNGGGIMPQIKILDIIWFFFMAVFFYLGYAYWRNSQNEIRQFYIRNQPKEGEEGYEGFQPIEEFVQQFNSYLDMVNSNAKTQNILASAGFFFGGLASLIAWILGFIE